MASLTYGTLEGVPTIYVEGGGGTYWYIDGKWKEATGTDSADIFTKATVLTKPEFDKLFGKLPAPPVT